MAKKNFASIRNTWFVSEARRKVKERAVAYKGGACSLCGYNKCIASLHFHHLDPKKKDFSIGQRVRSWPRVVREIEKCILVCANCHSEIHYNAERPRIQEQERIVRAVCPKRASATHGMTLYQYGCRCGICEMAAHLKYVKYAQAKNKGKKDKKVNRSQDLI